MHTFYQSLCRNELEYQMHFHLMSSNSYWEHVSGVFQPINFDIAIFTDECAFHEFHNITKKTIIGLSYSWKNFASYPALALEIRPVLEIRYVLILNLW